jgi:molecular chaperone GrpE
MQRLQFSVTRAVRAGVAVSISRGPLNFKSIARTISFTRPVMSSAEPVTPEEVPVEEAAKAEVVDPLQVAQKRIKELEEQAKENHNKLLRSYAEEENVRRIARKDVEDARNYANTSFAKSLLDVSDNLERALGAIPEDKMVGADAETSLKSLMDGVKLINKDLGKVFAKFHVKQYGATGDAFNPNLHDALYQIPLQAGQDAQLENTIGQVVKTGYMLKDRVLRAAEVGIIVKQTPTNTPPPTPTEKPAAVSGGY